MIKLKPKTWYYLYTDGESIFISQDAPTKREDNAWRHPELDFKTNGPPIYIDTPESSNNIVEFVNSELSKFDNGEGK